MHLVTKPVSRPPSCIIIGQQHSAGKPLEQAQRSLLSRVKLQAQNERGQCRVRLWEFTHTC